jgi:ABC-2 type transport system permease protein
MSPTKTFTTARRVLDQLKHDKRTLGLIFFVPCILLILLKYVFNENSRGFEAIAPMILGIFPLTVMFVVTSIAMLRERTTGTLDRLMTMPLSKLDLVFGYALAFMLLALIQASLASLVLLGVLGVTVQGGAFYVLICAVMAGFLGTSMGLLMSAFAKTEFQAVQFLPAFLLPQLLLCGLFVSRDLMAEPLQWAANILPLTYIVDAMKQVTLHSNWTGQLTRDLGIVLGFGLVALILGAITIRRTR